MSKQVVNEFHVAPVWLTRDYVEQKLRLHLKDKTLQLQELQIQPATANGENYSSVMTRINVKYMDKTGKNTKDTYLVKTTFADKDPTAYLLEPYGIYVREMNMYEEVLPKMSDILKQSLGDHYQQLFAGTMNVDRERNSIIFQDLSLENFFVADRIKQLDREHAQLALEKLALFHAASTVLNQRQPGIFADKYERCFFNKHTRGYQPMMENMIKALQLSLRDDEELYPRYGEKLKRVAEHIMEYCERLMEPKQDDFLTLCHGDLWTANMMFHNNAQGRPDNVLLIDFQFSVWNSPAIDLHYFFCTSFQDDLCHTEMVQFYYTKLVQALKNLNFKGHIPSLFDFQLQFQARAFYGIFAAFAFQPCMLHIGKDEFSIRRAICPSKEAEAVRISLYKTEIMRQKIKRFLPIFDRLGLLDDM
ncbi:uncharacterized protein LOC117573973 [Drosophila albomicans]|uniref:Uncharacterized protein LOC117573973 n=1 Tax=Drosophila albomicans TaxID=7291 RepID=A0A6P8XB19_DROAB|nr:uncharacterized protein LOC117573973 [Drosophila albomicans]